MNDAIYS